MHEPTILLGEFSGTASKAYPYLERHGWGRMWSSMNPQSAYNGEPWGFDNGAWSAFQNGTEFPEDKFLGRLMRAWPFAAMNTPPLLAVVPDIVEGGLDSLQFSLHWIDRLRQMGGAECSNPIKSWRWLLAVQDGMDFWEVAKVLPKFDGVFLGGSDEFKRTAPRWRTLSAGKWFHWGRCSRETWIADAISIGVDSLDSASPVIALSSDGVHRFKRFEQQVTGKHPQMWFA